MRYRSPAGRKGAARMTVARYEREDRKIANEPIGILPTDKMRLSRPHWLELVRQVRLRDGKECRYCGDVAKMIDIVAPSQPVTTMNAVVACDQCRHLAKHREFSTFFDKRRWLLKQERSRFFVPAGR